MEETSFRTHQCGNLNERHSESRVTVVGWVNRRRDHGHLLFVDLRDSSGMIQIVFNPDENQEAYEIANEVRAEYVVQVTGTVVKRQEGSENEALTTGSIEVKADSILVLNKSVTPPFPINQEANVEDSLRLQYRNLALRTERMNSN